MKLARPLLAVLVAFGFAVGQSCALGGQSGSAETGPINVGVVVSFTGRYAEVGQSILDGAQVAAKNIDDAGGINGRKINLIPIDTAGDPVDAVTAVRKMLAIDNVQGVIGVTGLEFSTALPILNQAPMVSFTHIGDPSIDGMEMPYSFSLVASDALIGAAMAKYASDKGYHRLALVFDANVGAQTVVPSIKHAASVLNLNVVADPALPENAPSYEAEIVQLLNANPDVILTQLDPQGAGTFFQELKKLGGSKIPVIGTDATADPAWVKAVGQPLDSTEVTSIVAGSGITGPALQYLQSTYQAMFNKPAPIVLASIGWDGMTLMALAMQDAHSVDPTVYYKKVLDVSTPGANVTVVYTFADGAKLLGEGTKIKFYGLASPLTFNTFHRVTGDYTAVKTEVGGASTKLGDIQGTSLDPLI